MQSGPTKALVQIHWCWPWLSLMQAPSFSQGFGRQGSISVKEETVDYETLIFDDPLNFNQVISKFVHQKACTLIMIMIIVGDEMKRKKTKHHKTRRTTLYQPLMHMMSVIHGLLPSQNSPTLPAGQLHVKLSVVVWQVPPYLQGFG